MRDPGLIIAQSVVNDADARQVIAELSCWHDELKPYARDIARDIGMPLELLHRIFKRLIAGGYVTYGPVYREDDGMPIGSTYWLTEQGVILRDALASGDTSEGADFEVYRPRSDRSILRLQPLPQALDT